MKYKKIGQFIKNIREQQGITQAQLAKELETTQSVIARIEKGEQNLSAETLNKISEVLNRPVAKLAYTDLDYFIEGETKLSGSITTNYSKNGAMALLSGSLLNAGTTILHGIPRIEEVNRMTEIMESIGVSTKWKGQHTLEIKRGKKLNLENINSASARKTRSILMFIAPLAFLFDNFKLPNADGCKLGARTIAAHVLGMQEMGLKVDVHETEYEISHDKLLPSDIVMYESGDTAAENVIMLAAKTPGITTIRKVSSNYMVQDLCFFLQALGVEIEGIGTPILKVHGIEDINKDLEFSNSEDPIESMVYIAAAIVTESELEIKRCPIDFLELELCKLKAMGQKYEITPRYKSKNGQTDLVDIKLYPSKLKALADKIHPMPYPGINIDNLPFFVPIALKAEGQTLIHDWVYENRAIYYMELQKLGAKLTFADIHRVFVEGTCELKGAQIVAPTAIRPAMCIMLAMMAARGNSILRNVYFISRAYENIVERLNSIGAKIKVINQKI